MPIGIMIDQLGTHLVLCPIGILVICFYSEGVVFRRNIFLGAPFWKPIRSFR